MTHERRRLRATRALLACGGVLAALVLLEVAIHAVEAWRGPLFRAGLGNPLLRHHPLLGLEHVPDAVYPVRSREAGPDGSRDLRTNNLGLRADAPTAIEKPAGVTRVLVLGDSQTDAYVANRDSWPMVLEGSLDGAPGGGGRRFEVLNAGVVGYAPMHEYLWWRLRGRELDADVVVLAYYVGNDLLGADGGRLRQGADGRWELDESPRPPPTERLRTRLVRACRLCGLVRDGLPASLVDDVMARVGMLTPADLVHRRYGGCIWDSLEQTRLLSGNPDAYAAKLRATEEILRRLRDETAAAGQRFVVALLPSKIQIEDDGEAEHVASLLGIELPPEPFEDRVRRDVGAVCERLGIATVDLRPELAAAHAAAGAPLFYPADWHLNALGNRAVGESAALRAAVSEAR